MVNTQIKRIGFPTDTFQPKVVYRLTEKC